MGQGLFNHQIRRAVMIDVQCREGEHVIFRLESQFNIFGARQVDFDAVATASGGRSGSKKKSSVRLTVAVKVGNGQRPLE